MVFNGDVNGEDLCTLCDDQNGTNDTNYPLARKARNANWGMRMIWTWIFGVYGGWVYDDKNQIDLPEAKTNLVANQIWYALPVEEDSLIALEWMDSYGNWQKLRRITIEEIRNRGYAEADFMNISGNPEFYRPTADGFKLYPASDSSVALGLRSLLMREMVTFTPDTTDIAPGFDSLYHPAVAIFMALQYGRGTLSTVSKLQKEWDGNEASTGKEGGYKKTIKEHYKIKFRQNTPPTLQISGAGGFSYADEMT